MVCTPIGFTGNTKSVAMKRREREREMRFACGLFANAVSAVVCCCSDLAGDIHGPCAGRAEAAGVQRGDVSPDKLFTLPCGNVRRPPLLSFNCQSSTFSDSNRSTSRQSQPRNAVLHRESPSLTCGPHGTRAHTPVGESLLHRSLNLSSLKKKKKSIHSSTRVW